MIPCELMVCLPQLETWMMGAQVLLQGGAKMEYEPNPFASEGGDELAAVAYRCAPHPEHVMSPLAAYQMPRQHAQFLSTVAANPGYMCHALSKACNDLCGAARW